MIISNKVGILSALIALSAPDAALGHGYMKTPRSRNYHANLNGKWSGGTANDPAPESCPHCLNVGGPGISVCGAVGDHNYDLPPNAIGGVMPTVIQECYAPGSIIDVESQITAHHMGHFEMRACPIRHGQVPTQACFDSNPLKFISDELYGGVPDVNYPERAYIPRTDFPGGLNNNFFHHKYQLPAGLTGELVLLQWYWVTANSCVDEGYDEYPFPDYFYPGNKNTCRQPVEVTLAAEQFWNCAEVKISNDCGGVSPPTPSTTAAPTTAATVTTDSPVTPDPTSKPTYFPTYLPTDGSDTSPAPTDATTSTPTMTPPHDTPSPTPIESGMIATFDTSLGVPRCASLATSCSSGELLNGRGSIVGGTEPNGSNTLDMCEDGWAGEYHIDQSLDKIVVKSTDRDGSDSSETLTEGGRATIVATVFPVSNADGTLSYDYADFYTATDASNPEWTYIGTESPDPSITGLQEMKMTYTLPKGTNQAVRVNFRFLGDRGANEGCSGGPYDDTDDIVFAVKENAEVTASPIGAITASPTKKPSDSYCRGFTEICGAEKPCPDGSCCSQWGYCGTTEGYCGLCCQSGSCW